MPHPEHARRGPLPARAPTAWRFFTSRAQVSVVNGMTAPDADARRRSTPSTGRRRHAGREQPYAALGLKPDEYERIRDILGRRPTSAELAMYSVMWSEHCSYKSSARCTCASSARSHRRDEREAAGRHGRERRRRRHRRRLGRHLQGREPQPPDATSSRTRARRPASAASCATSSRWAPARSRSWTRCASARSTTPTPRASCTASSPASAATATASACPTSAARSSSTPCYQGNPLVNALASACCGTRTSTSPTPSGAGNKVVLFGARTGGDGIGGASLLASETVRRRRARPSAPPCRSATRSPRRCSSSAASSCSRRTWSRASRTSAPPASPARPASSPPTATAACRSTSTRCCCATPSLTPEEILMSESQERMMAIVAPDKLDAFLAVTDKWDVETSRARRGHRRRPPRRSTGTARRSSTSTPRTVAVDGPVYERPVAYPAWTRRAAGDDSADGAAPPGDRRRAARHVRCSWSPARTCADTAWVTNQYDRYVMGNTALAHARTTPAWSASTRSPASASRSRPTATAATPARPVRRARSSPSPRRTATSPSPGAVPAGRHRLPQLRLAREPRGHVAVRARPSRACRRLPRARHPGHRRQRVSFYNQTGDVAIHPTPVVGVLGVHRRRRPPHARRAGRTPGQNIYLLGATARRARRLGVGRTSCTATSAAGRRRSTSTREQRLGRAPDHASRDGLVDAAHDLSDGGLAQALAEACLRFGVGARRLARRVCERDGVDAFAALFSESTGRVIVVGAARGGGAVHRPVRGPRLPVRRASASSTTAGEALEVQGLFTLPLAELRAAHSATLPAAFGH